MHPVEPPPIAPPQPGRAARARPAPHDVGDFDVSMRVLVNEMSWPPFLMTYKNMSQGCPHGAVQATCPFHKKTSQTLCKKTFNLRERTLDHGCQVVWALRHWCNAAPTYDRQRYHVGHGFINLATVPDTAVILHNRLPDDAPEVPKTDADLDLELAQASDRPGDGGGGGARSAGAKRNRGRGGERVGGQGRGRGSSAARRGGRRPGTAGRSAGQERSPDATALDEGDDAAGRDEDSNSSSSSSSSSSSASSSSSSSSTSS